MCDFSVPLMTPGYHAFWFSVFISLFPGSCQLRDMCVPQAILLGLSGWLRFFVEQEMTSAQAQCLEFLSGSLGGRGLALGEPGLLSSKKQR